MAETLREFLVSIGYAVDEPSERAWSQSLAKVAKGIAVLSAAVLSAEAAIVAFVTRATVSLDQANWAASRAGTSVGAVKALEYAMRQTGGGGAIAPVAAIAAALRQNPNLEGVLKFLGVKTREGQSLRDTTDILLDFVEATKRLSHVQGADYASRFGLSEPDYEHIRRTLPQIRAFIEEQQAHTKAMGLDWTRAGGQSAAMMQNYRSAMMQIGIAIDALIIAVTPPLIDIMSGLEQWVSENQDGIVRFVHAFIDAAEDLLRALGGVVASLAPVADGFLDLASGSGTLVVAVEAVSGAFLAGAVLRILRGIGGVRGAFLAVLATLAAGAYVRGQVYVGGIKEAREGPDDRPRQTIWQRGAARVREFFGAGGKDEAGMTGSHPRPKEGPPLDRSSFEDELKDDNVRKRLLALTEAEVGRQGEDAQQAFMETIFNRAKARNQSLWDTMHGSYFPGSTHSRTAARTGDPALDRKYKEIYERVRGGSNTTGGATGNASGSVGFGAGGFKTIDFGGEKFGVEERDANWWRRNFRGGAPLMKATPWGDPSAKIKSDPLVSAPDENAVTMNKSTSITVQGDTDPTKTAIEVERSMNRSNSDMITTTQQAAP